MRGKIIRGVSGFFDVVTEEGEVYRCRAKGTFRREGVKPLPGDDVSFDITHEGDKEGNVTEVFPRKNALLRPPVANVDQVLFVFAAAHPDPSHYLLNRFLVMTAQLALPVILCFNKRDLTTEEEAQAIREIYAGCGCPLLVVSVKEQENLSALIPLLAGKTTAVAGPSGVGKSSLINALLQEEKMETGEISRKTARGKNTTRHSELFLLPDALFADADPDLLSEDREPVAQAHSHTHPPSYVFDTPGFMSLKPEGITPKNLHEYIPEFTALDAGCRYAGCTHISEPDCAVKDALEAGGIHRVRYDAYKLYYDELSGERPVYVKKAKKEPG